MKKIICILSVSLFLGTALVFACTYNEKDHTLTECTEYVRGEGDIPQSCQDAHTAYNKYVASQVGKKAKKAASKAGNAIMKFVGDVMNDEEKENSDLSNNGNPNNF